MEIEAVLEDERKRADAGYSLIRHIDVLIAMVGEARVLRAVNATPRSVT